MQQLGLSESDLERIIELDAPTLAMYESITSGDKTEALIKGTAAFTRAVERALRQVARAIVENNERIAEQLEKAGIKIT